MKKNIKATNIELTQAITDYLDKRFDTFDKFISADDESVLCDIEVGKTTHHHKSGDIFRAEVNLHIPGKDFYASSKKEDLYSAIDEVKDEITRAIKSHKSKNTTLARKGALRFKNILRGITDFKNKK